MNFTEEEKEKLLNKRYEVIDNILSLASKHDKKFLLLSLLSEYEKELESDLELFPVEEAKNPSEVYTRLKMTQHKATVHEIIEVLATEIF